MENSNLLLVKLMKTNKIIRLLNTVKYLKIKQVYYRLYYFVRNNFRRRLGVLPLLSVPSSSPSLLILEPSIPAIHSYEEGSFSFLNLFHKFEKGIDWNYSNFGKLWTYNLTYFEYLNQTFMSRKEGLQLINDYIEQGAFIKDGLEPFPTALRGVNWIKFLTTYNIHNQTINDSLYAQYLMLQNNLEYHLLGNHLLENAFSLLFAAYYFQDEKMYGKAKEILVNELNEQILDDGAHFELSPMYHQIMLFRVLDCINLTRHNNWKNHELQELLEIKASAMLSWLNIVTFRDGTIPLLNDSANKIAPTTKELNIYAQKLNILLMQQLDKTQNIQLADSGYRKIRRDKYECIVDMGNIGPDYIPGHAHSDTFNFELYINRKPFIVDVGTSTYEANEKRTLERSTLSHNTVELEGLDQSEVWGGFRVANRAFVVDMQESTQYIKATHNGYKKRLNALHQREFVFKEMSIKIIDRIKSIENHNAIARLHLYPGIKVTLGELVIILDDIKIYLNMKEGYVKIKDYYYAPEFNIKLKAEMIEIYFTNYLEMEVQL